MTSGLPVKEAVPTIMKQLLPVILLLAACSGKHNPRYHHPATQAGDSLYRFKEEVNQLRERTSVFVLRDTTGKGAMAVTPSLGGQVIASTTDSVQGFSVGWNKPDGEDMLAFQVTASAKNVLVLTRRDSTGLQYERKITLIARRDIPNYLDGLTLHRNIEAIAFESHNVLVNTGAVRDSVCIDVTGQFPNTDDIRLLLPDKTTKKFLIVKPDKAAEVPLEKAANYFGYYDADQEILTIIQFTLPVTKQTYFPIIAKNGAALTLGSRSPLTKLPSGGRLEHYHRTIHLAGTPKRLEPVLKKLFGISLKQLEATF